ncbi:MAG TPA: HAD family phosphatase [Bacteroidota bacterium]|nr:HAD family phosphatase [Bacteroidota bacterium]
MRRGQQGEPPRVGRPAIRAVAFDLGGVLVRNRYEMPILRNAAKALGTTPAALHAIMRRELGPLERGKQNEVEFWRLICRRLNRPVPPPRVLRSLWSYRYRRNVHLNNGVKRLVLALKRAYPVIAISNTIPAHIRVNRALGVYDLFDDVLLSSEIGLRKPDREIFRRGLRLTGSSARNTLFIDDDMRWVRAARRSGLCAIQFTSVRELKKRLKQYRLVGLTGRQSETN